MATSAPKEVNILLLGETGVGKSTFINGFANYLNYDTFEDALQGKTICLIPAQFIVTDANYEDREVSYGMDSNESYEIKGQSVTQKCRAYTFNYGDTLIRLIDTPGVGDTRGFDQDKVNFDNLLSFIAEYDVLHLICILLKPDMQRLTASFQYCLKQLLCHLQKDASRNMVFLFTNTRSTFYRPKNTMVLLRQILAEIKEKQEVVIPVEKSTMYCLDNDSFQFLIALRNGISFGDDEKRDYANSWEKSVNESMRLMKYIISGKDGNPLPPHSIQNTLSINETRRLILALNKPIAKIAETIGSNTSELEKTKREVENFTGNIQNLLEKISSNDYKLEYGLEDFIPIVNIFTLSYKHGKVREAQEAQKRLRNELETVAGSKKVKETLLQQIENVITESKDERKQIVQASAKFAYFLKKNAIAAYNDSYKDCLLEHIENAKFTNNRELIENLNKLLEDYEKEKTILEEAIEKGLNKETKESVTLDQINAAIEQLYLLKVTGTEIKKLHEESKSKQCSTVKDEVEHSVDRHKGKKFWSYLKSKHSNVCDFYEDFLLERIENAKITKNRELIENLNKILKEYVKEKKFLEEAIEKGFNKQTND